MSKKSKKNPFPKGFTIDGEDSYAIYHTPEMEERIRKEREIRKARSSGSSRS